MTHVSPAGEFMALPLVIKVGVAETAGTVLLPYCQWSQWRYWPRQAGHHKLHKLPNTTLPPSVATGEGTALYTTQCNLHDPLADSPW